MGPPWGTHHVPEGHGCSDPLQGAPTHGSFLVAAATQACFAEVQGSSCLESVGEVSQSRQGQTGSEGALLVLAARHHAVDWVHYMWV